MNIRPVIAMAMSGLLLIACSESPREDSPAAAYQPSFDGDAVKAHVELLSDDLYEGREAASRGYDLAAAYVATQFRLLGLDPGNAESFFQEVPFRGAQIVPGTRSLSIGSGDVMVDYETFADFTSSARLSGENVSISAPLVFMGYGVNAPLVERNDYEGIDLKGKIAVVVSGAPKALGSEKRAFYRSGQHKYSQLQKNGAIGVVTLQHKVVASEAAGVRGSKSVKYWWTDHNHEPQDAFQDIGASTFLLDKGARKLFESSPISFDAMAAQMESETYAPFEMGMSATISHRQVLADASSKNVIGVLEGSDPALKNEYLVLSAHLDGVGMTPGNEDPVNNGFYDNASGIGVMLEVARALVNAPQRPRRSIIFLATTGEEKGLLGAEFFANNPTQPIQNIVSNVNMDMAIFMWRVKDVVAFGAKHSSMETVVDRAVRKAGLEYSPDPFPERGYFTRSDQFPFVKQGVPAVFLATGFQTEDNGLDPEAIYNDFMMTHYHGPSDDANLRFDTWSAAKIAEVNYYISLDIANAEQRPTWNKDDFFGGMYGTDATSK